MGLTPAQERELARKLDGWWCDGQLELVDPAEPEFTAPPCP
jgi:hypothetical protein